jgi:hypothetical protein
MTIDTSSLSIESVCRRRQSLDPFEQGATHGVHLCIDLPLLIECRRIVISRRGFSTTWGHQN